MPAPAHRPGPGFFVAGLDATMPGGETATEDAMASQWRPLTALSDDELDDRLRRKADHVDWSYQNVLDEMNRRSADRSARWSLRLAWIVAIATIVNAFAAIAAAWAAIVVAQRPGS